MHLYNFLKEATLSPGACTFGNTFWKILIIELFDVFWRKDKHLSAKKEMSFISRSLSRRLQDIT